MESGNGRRILVVDDEPSIVDAVATAFRYEGFDVEVSFVFFTATTPLIVALVLVGLIGAVAGWLARGQVRKRL